MAGVRLTQETVLKHFMKRSAALLPTDPGWLRIAASNHSERFGAGVLDSNVNTLILIKPEVWESLVDGSIFGDDHAPPQMGAQLAVTIEKEYIDRVITTRKNADNFRTEDDLVGDNVVDQTFLCRWVDADGIYEIAHRET